MLWCAVVCCVCVPRYVDAALYLTELQSDGVLGAVGVTNFDVPRLEAMVNKGAQLVSNQVGGAAPWGFCRSGCRAFNFQFASHPYSHCMLEFIRAAGAGKTNINSSVFSTAGSTYMQVLSLHTVRACSRFAVLTLTCVPRRALQR